ncbi:MAG: shikimate dehydrogenase [Chthoniobacteraceae bacterium]
MQKDVYTFADLQNWPQATAGITPPIRLSVFGDPVAHSKSPAMHNAALAACGIDAQYIRLQISPGELADAVRLLPENGFLGTNVTIPHKVAMLSLMDEVDDNARKIGTVNTVVIDGKKLRGFNTDGPGIVRAIRSEFSVDLRDLRVMLLGAGGGAGRAIAMQCGFESCERLVLVNRTFEKAKALADELQPLFRSTKLLGPVARLEAIPWDEAQLKFQLQHTDLVINATSIGMKFSDPSPLPASLLTPSLMLYDTIYTSARTPLLRAADEAGARSANGLSMLLHQGALSFEIWFNREAPLEAMRTALLL